MANGRSTRWEYHTGINIPNDKTPVELGVTSMREVAKREQPNTENAECA